MIESKTFFGDCKNRIISTTLQLVNGEPRLQLIEATASNINIKLPPANEVITGGVHFYIINVGSLQLNIKDFVGGTVATIAAGQIGIFQLESNSTSAGSWRVTVRNVFGTSNTDLIPFASVLAIGCDPRVNLTRRGKQTLAGRVSITANLSAKLGQQFTKELAGRLSISVNFSPKFGSYPVSNIVSPTATGSGDGSLGSPYTLKQAASLAVPGDVITLRGGTYSNTSSHIIDSVNAVVKSGNSSDGIIYRNYPGEVPVLTGANRIKNCQYITFEGIKFLSSGKSHISTTSSGTQRNITFDGCEFDSQYFSATDPTAAFTGILMQGGQNFAFKNCKFGKWYTGDFLAFLDSDHILVENCDFSQAGAPHMIMGCMECGYIYVRNCIFRNPWSRCTRMGRRGDTSTKKYMLVEDCVFIDSNWNRVDPHPGDTEGNLGDTETFRLQMENSIFRNCIIAGHNPGLTDKTTGQPFTYSCGLELHHYDQTKNYDHVRIANCVIHRSRNCGFSALYNTSAGVIRTTDVKFKNVSITIFDLYGINITSLTIPWDGWMFEKCRVWDTVKTKTMFLRGASPELQTVSQAMANQGEVFKNMISTSPTYQGAQIFDQFDANPAAFSLADISRFFDGFTEATPVAGVEFATVTANGTSVTTINVDDAYWFMPPTAFYGGDKISVGGDITTVAAILSPTQIQVSPAITVAAGDKIYLERQKDTAYVGVFSVLQESKPQPSGKSSLGVTLTSRLKGTKRQKGTLSINVPGSANLTVQTSLVDIDFESGTLAEFGSLVNSSKLVAGTAGALKGTKGMAVTVDSSGVAYGTNSISWSTRYLRFRCYFDPNTITMADADEFYIMEFRSAGGQSSGYLRVVKRGSAYKVFCGQRKDDGTYGKTAEYTITDAPHYIEVEFARASSNVAADGSTSLWVDGVLKETVSGLDVYDVNRPVTMYAGAITGLDIGTSGTFYLDDIIVKDQSVTIGA